MNLGSNFNKKKRKGKVQNKTKWKNSFGGKRLSGGKNQEERREKKSGQKIGENIFVGWGYNPIANRKRRKKGEVF